MFRFPKRAYTFHVTSGASKVSTREKVASLDIPHRGCHDSAALQSGLGDYNNQGHSNEEFCPPI